MPRTTALLSVSLPPAMAEELDRVRRSEHRTRSELVREALRKYIREADMERARARVAAFPEDTPHAEETAAIEAGKRELRAGMHRPFQQLRHELRASRRPPRRKKP
ncbi:MAG TPA: ribbon-helix-helix domain-containing protein [Alphaproteobacteria bacterium]|nr:ribbon-helix-helix domain-containing protein [Alphaproteobacteria bacterium]